MKQSGSNTTMYNVAFHTCIMTKVTYSKLSLVLHAVHQRSHVRVLNVGISLQLTWISTFLRTASGSVNLNRGYLHGVVMSDRNTYLSTDIISTMDYIANEHSSWNCASDAGQNEQKWS